MGEPAQNIDPKQEDGQGLSAIEGGREDGEPNSSREQIKAVPDNGDRVYDGSGVGQSEPVPRTLSGIKGGGEGGKSPGSTQLGVAGSPNDPNIASKKELGNAEDKVKEPDKGKVDDKEKGAGDNAGQWKTNLGDSATGAAAATGGIAGAAIKAGRMGARVFGGKKGFTKKKGAAAGIAILLVSGIIFLFSIAQGPLQLIHLSEILRRPFAGQEDAEGKRVRGFFRYARTGEFGETRVSIFGSRSVKKSLAELKAKGIEFPDRTPLGRFKTVTIDPDNPKSPWHGVSKKDLRAKIAADLGAESKDINRLGPLYKIEVDVTTRKGIVVYKTIGLSALGQLDDGTIVGAMKKRHFKRFFGMPRLLSPIQPKTIEWSEKLASKLGRKEVAEERASPRKEAVKLRASAARARLSSAVEGKEAAISSALVSGAAICLVRDVADDVVAVNHAAIVVPSIIEATDKTALGAQAKAGANIDLGQAGGEIESFTDKNGKTIWTGKALNALANGGVGNGEEIPAEHQQAFSNKTTAQSIKDHVSEKLGGDVVAGVACSVPGQIVQIGASLALLAAGPVTGGATWKAFVIKAGAGAAASGGAMLLLKKLAVAALKSDALVPIPPSGPLGGNILAYGARASAGMSCRASGCVALEGTEKTTVQRELQEKHEHEFRSKSFLARTFDVYDYRSLLSKTVIHSNPNPANALNSLASSVSNLASGTFGSIFGLFTKAAFAQPEGQQYDWDFPQYGIPKKILGNPKYADPIGNAEALVGVFKGSDKYEDKARKCFGVEISEGANGWQSKVEEEVNPNSDEYIKGEKCNDIKDENWARTILFVMDDQTILAMTCFDGDRDDQATIEACDELGVGNAEAAPAEESAGTEIDIENLKKPSDSIDCAPNTKDAGVIDGYTGGQKVRIRLCEITNLPQGSGFGSKNGHATANSRVSGAVYAMVEAAKKDGVEMRAVSSSRTMADQRSLCPCDGVRVARAGFSNHQLGVAIDFGGNGQLMDRSNPMWKWLNDNADKFGYKPYDVEPWHWSPFGS
ncbi:M15 family metallopeptidase [Candidatus Parcubacteria bacterium]|nr:M15 family metallopeptidase [Candidatus Parcubacteria bacterium]